MRTRASRLDKIGKPTVEKLINSTGVFPKGKLESAGSKGWGGKTEQIVTPSGVKLKFEEDEEAILKFVGIKDISDVMGEPEGTVIYNTFWDGKRLVTMACSYSFKKVEFIPGVWYYLWVAGRIVNRNPDFNPMKDFEIRKLGEDGEEVQCPDKISDDCVLKLDEDLIAEINYNRLNYPLRIS
jgi:hypothetical protein